VSFVTVSKKRPGRVYHRHFDHDEALRLRALGWSYQRIADHAGVSVQAVARVVNPRIRERMDSQTLDWARKHLRKPCLGGCDRLVWSQKSRSGYCPRCFSDLRVAADVRPEELRCTSCREWKADKEFGRTHGAKARRGCDPECRSCSSARRRRHRQRTPEQQKEAGRRRTDRRRKGKTMSRYIVFQPNGQGFVEVSRVDAASPAHAVEKAATSEGQYVAVPEGKFKLMRVAPVQALRVVSDAAESSGT
jgi:hypothetical protein